MSSTNITITPINTLSSSAFRLLCPKFSFLETFVQEVTLPSVSSSPAKQSTPRLAVFYPSAGNISYEEFQASFLVDEQFNTWAFFHRWFRSANGAPNVADQKAFIQEFNTNKLCTTDISIILLTNAGNYNKKVTLHDALPTTIGSLQFTTKETEYLTLSCTVSFKFSDMTIE